MYCMLNILYTVEFVETVEDRLVMANCRLLSYILQVTLTTQVFDIFYDMHT